MGEQSSSIHRKRIPAGVVSLLVLSSVVLVSLLFTDLRFPTRAEFEDHVQGWKSVLDFSHADESSNKYPDAHPSLKGCRVCQDPEHFSPTALDDERNTTKPLICQSFWHKKYATWEECRTAALEMRSAFRKELCARCNSVSETNSHQSDNSSPKADSKTTTMTTGLVYGFTGGMKYLTEVYRSVKVVRSASVGYRGIIQVFSDSQTMAETCNTTMRGLNVDCRVLRRKPTVGYTSKLLALLDSDLDVAVMLDTDNIVTRNPEEWVLPALQRRGPVVLWPDLWGHACLQFHWPVADDNPDGHMLCGQSAWPQHVGWAVTDVTWQPHRPFAQENLDSMVILDKRHGLAVAAVELAVWMSEQEFWIKVLYGEKDCVRLALLAMGVHFTMTDEGPWQVSYEKSPGRMERKYAMGVWNGTALSVDQVKGRPNAQAHHIVKPSAIRDETGSWCSPDYSSFAINTKFVHVDGSAKHLLEYMTKVAWES